MILVIFLLIIILSIISIYISGEKYINFKRKRAHKKKIQLGFLKDTPSFLKDLTISLQKIGGQLHEDTRFDHVSTDYLDPKNIT